jgi:hypothetical protein
MDPWSTSDFEHGSEVTLDALHELVPETDLIDLAETPTAGQALGMLEHLLGATPIDE